MLGGKFGYVTCGWSPVSAFRNAAAFLLFYGEHVFVAFEITVERGVGRDQRSLEYGNGLLDVVVSDRIAIGWKGVVKCVDVAWDAFELHQASSGVMPISTGLAMGPPACSFKSAARPSRNRAALNTELSTVGAFRPRAANPGPRRWNGHRRRHARCDGRCCS